MPSVRFRIRTIMIVVALVAMVMAVLHVTLWLYNLLGAQTLLAVVVVGIALFLAPIVALVEVLLLIGYSWFRRNRTGPILTPRSLIAPEPQREGGRDGVG